ncbi:MAG: amidohydrolase [Gammaproteobacteria bacterium]
MLRSRLFTAILILMLATPMVSRASDTELTRDVAKDYDASLSDLFVHLHQNPELSNVESKTAARLARELEAVGFDVTTGVGGHGVVAVMENGPGPVVMLRADMDGLPVTERSGLSYASTARQVDANGVEQSVMHACGHDVHVTGLIGAARQLNARRDDWAGTLVLIGQPAEEIISGARQMIQDGLFERFPKPEYALAFHVSAQRTAGQIHIPEGIAYSSSDSVDIAVHGVGAHGASPHKGIDPVLVAAQIVVSLQSVVSRTISPLDAGVITVGSIHGGTKHNIIGERVDLQLTVRSNSYAVREQLLNAIDRVAAGVAQSLGVPQDKFPEVVRSPTKTTGPTINHVPTAQRVDAAFRRHFGDARMDTRARDGMGAEDFAYFVDPKHGVKGVYFSVGGTPADEVATAASHHSPLFKVSPAPSVKTGAEAMVVATLALMAR